MEWLICSCGNVGWKDNRKDRWFCKSHSHLRCFYSDPQGEWWLTQRGKDGQIWQLWRVTHAWISWWITIHGEFWKAEMNRAHHSPQPLRILVLPPQTLGLLVKIHLHNLREIHSKMTFPISSYPSLSLHYIFLMILCTCVCEKAYMYLSVWAPVWHMCIHTTRRATCRSSLFLSSIWVQGTELRSSGFVASVFTHWGI